MSKTEAALFNDLALEITHWHCCSVLLFTQVHPSWCGRNNTRTRCQEGGFPGDVLAVGCHATVGRPAVADLSQDELLPVVVRWGLGPCGISLLTVALF